MASSTLGEGSDLDFTAPLGPGGWESVHHPPQEVTVNWQVVDVFVASMEVTDTLDHLDHLFEKKNQPNKL